MRLILGGVAVIAILIWIGLASSNTHTVVAGSPNTLAAKSSCTVTAEGYARLNAGDSYRTAVNKLGCPGSEMSRSDLAGYSTVTYIWYGASLMGNMNAMFQNDALVSKAQFGL